MTQARTAKPRALILAQFAPLYLERLRLRFEVSYESWLDTGVLQDPEELGLRLEREGVECLVTEADFVWAETFEAAPGLRFVGLCRGEAGSHIDLSAATAHGVRVVTTPGRNAIAVAELTIGLLLALARRLPQADAYVRNAKWESSVDSYSTWGGIELAGRTAGLIGFGAVGRAVAQRLQGMDMDVLVHDPYLAGDTTPTGVQVVSLGHLLAAADFVSLHCTLSADTRGLLGPKQLAMLRPHAFLINTARAALVDEAALLSGLRAREIAGAALDVHYVEPLPPGSPWLTLESVILTPHIGGATNDVVMHHSRRMTEALEDYVGEIDGARQL